MIIKNKAFFLMITNKPNKKIQLNKLTIINKICNNLEFLITVLKILKYMKHNKMNHLIYRIK
jgi:hypothetical protein